MIELALWVCLTGNPHACHEELLGAAEGGLISCMVAAPQQAAAWGSTHPKYRVARTICRAPGKSA